MHQSTYAVNSRFYANIVNIKCWPDSAAHFAPARLRAVDKPWVVPRLHSHYSDFHGRPPNLHPRLREVIESNINIPGVLDFYC